ncbi:Tim17-domain-containing protein [Hesseltinella vesiculosa]|uniref:Tim17-domain-containing protein n=1 Tax=Hesseltinella vesiculosa TaxID=101127 RepID=A0A1X2G849_9FUNG|nr:Tim17-domain-containing protein [Hesseltinella vesiculosa]
MGIFGFGSSNNDNSNTQTLDNADDLYSPSGGSGLEQTSSFGDNENAYDKLPDFMTSMSYDTTKLQPMAMQGGVDFLQVEDPQQSANFGGNNGFAPSRGWTDDLCYGTGTAYLAGLTLGGAVGLAEGLKKSSDAPNMKVRLNTTLNTITRRGPGLGNSVGVIAMLYNGTTAMIDASRGKHDIFNSIAGGAVAGALFKSTAGPRACAMASGACAAVAGAWSLLAESFSS